jgi:hypothetical protein
MWTESRSDSKLDALSDREFRIWHKLLCYSAESEPRGVVDYEDPDFVALELRVDPDELSGAIARMARVRLVELEDSFVTFPAFHCRQYDKPSDTPEATAERKRLQRERERTQAVDNPLTPDGDQSLTKSMSRPVTPSHAQDVPLSTSEDADGAEGVTPGHAMSRGEKNENRTRAYSEGPSACGKVAPIGRTQLEAVSQLRREVEA